MGTRATPYIAPRRPGEKIDELADDNGPMMTQLCAGPIFSDTPSRGVNQRVNQTPTFCSQARFEFDGSIALARTSWHQSHERVNQTPTFCSQARFEFDGSIALARTSWHQSHEGSATSRLSFGARAATIQPTSPPDRILRPDSTVATAFLLEMHKLPAFGLEFVAQRRAAFQTNAVLATRWPWNHRRPDRSAAAASEIRPPAARLNQRPKLLTVSSQHSPLSPNRSRIGDSRPGILPRLPARNSAPSNPITTNSSRAPSASNPDSKPSREPSAPADADASPHRPGDRHQPVPRFARSGPLRPEARWRARRSSFRKAMRRAGMPRASKGPSDSPAAQSLEQKVPKTLAEPHRVACNDLMRSYADVNSDSSGVSAMPARIGLRST